MLPRRHLHGLSSGGPGAKKHLADIRNAEDATHATARGEGVRGRLRTKIRKAAAKSTGDLDVLVTFDDYPAEHWVRPRTTNPTESTFATVRYFFITHVA